MHVWVSTPFPEMAAAIWKATCAAGIECDFEPNIQEFGSQLFSIPDSVGVLWAQGRASAVQHCRRMRMGDIRTPLMILLDACDAEHAARSAALDAGADDAQPWPIDMVEFICRLQAIARRERENDARIYWIAGCHFNFETGIISTETAAVALTRTEAKVLQMLVMRAGSAVTREALMDHVYGGRPDPDTKIIDVYVLKVRRKLQAIIGDIRVIETVWGRGYRLYPDGQPGVRFPSLSTSRVSA